MYILYILYIRHEIIYEVNLINRLVQSFVTSDVKKY